MSDKAAAGQSRQRCISSRLIWLKAGGSIGHLSCVSLRGASLGGIHACDFTTNLAQRRCAGFGGCYDASNAGVHTFGSQSYQGGCSLPGPSQRDADVPHVQVLHVGRQERWHVHGHDGNRSLPTSRRWDQPNGMVRLVCSCVTRPGEGGEQGCRADLCRPKSHSNSRERWRSNSLIPTQSVSFQEKCIQCYQHRAS
jgi:hypothetical protein